MQTSMTKHTKKVFAVKYERFIGDNSSSFKAAFTSNTHAHIGPSTDKKKQYFKDIAISSMACTGLTCKPDLTVETRRLHSLTRASPRRGFERNRDFPTTTLLRCRQVHVTASH